jgi:hypothetical protein
MIHIYRKMFWLWQYEKEEQWLNEMSAKGLQLISVGLSRYTFQDGVPGEYNYRLELLNNPPSHEKSREYITFLEDTGAEHIASLFRWAYFRKKASYGPFDLFSDADSKIRHHRRVSSMIGIYGGMNMALFLMRAIEWFIDGERIPYVHFLNLAAALLCLYAFYRIEKKIARLKKRKTIYE